LPVSIYRPARSFDPAAADVSGFATLPVQDRGSPAIANPDPGAARWGHLRKAVPVLRLRPETVRWAARLPEPVRPYALMREYPRVANRLAVAAASPVSLTECLADLLIDRRGGRRGFPAAVAQDLLRLRAYLDRVRGGTG
jgi:hypothetical protein